MPLVYPAQFDTSCCTRHLHAIGSGQVDIWLCFYDRHRDPRLLEHWLELLDPGERAQELRYYFADDRLRYRATRALVRSVLSHYVPAIPASAWAFISNQYGRPEIANPDPQAALLRFNISHTRGLIALAVSREAELGIDVEHVNARAISIEVSNRFFSPEEAQALAQMPAAFRQDRFFEYWTFKESYIKARGMGLSLALNEFSVGFPGDGEVCLSMAASLADTPDRWCLAQFRPTPDYLLAVCVERKGSRRPRFALHETTPARSTSPFEVPVLRQSP